MLVLRYEDESFKKRKRPVVFTSRCETRWVHIFARVVPWVQRTYMYHLWALGWTYSPKLAETKRQSLTDSNLRPCIPEAVGQAIAWATVTGFVVTVISLRESSLKLVKAKRSFVFAVKRTVMRIFYPEIRRLKLLDRTWASQCLSEVVHLNG